MAQPDNYSLDSSSVKMFFVFNNVNFKKKSLETRYGSNKDAADLNKIFAKLGFVTNEPFKDCTHKDFFTKLDEICATVESTQNIGCLAMAFLSHGSKGRLHMYDHKVDVDEIVETLENVGSLYTKPKMLIFQACRGKKVAKATQSDSWDQADADVESITLQEHEEGTDLLSTVPLIADFVMCNSTSLGYVSFRNTNYGSRYIQKFCEVLEAYAEDNTEQDFLQLLTKISAEVAKMKPKDERRQMPSITSTLTKLLYLPRGCGATTVPTAQN